MFVYHLISSTSFENLDDDNDKGDGQNVRVMAARNEMRVQFNLGGPWWPGFIENLFFLNKVFV